MDDIFIMRILSTWNVHFYIHVRKERSYVSILPRETTLLMHCTCIIIRFIVIWKKISIDPRVREKVNPEGIGGLEIGKGPNPGAEDVF
jgi:hypothetical protein